jgi:translation initiation factor 3 subunit B
VTSVLVNFFDTRSGAKLRTFMGPISDFIAQGQQGLRWPVFKWSGQSSDESGCFFAKMGTGMISVYAAPEMTLVDKKSIKVDGVVDFCWSRRILSWPRSNPNKVSVTNRRAFL